jgi:hypothetical protein
VIVKSIVGICLCCGSWGERVLSSGGSSSGAYEVEVRGIVLETWSETYGDSVVVV